MLYLLRCMFNVEKMLQIMIFAYTLASVLAGKKKNADAAFNKGRQDAFS